MRETRPQPGSTPDEPRRIDTVVHDDYGLTASDGTFVRLFAKGDVIGADGLGPRWILVPLSWSRQQIVTVPVVAARGELHGNLAVMLPSGHTEAAVEVGLSLDADGILCGHARDSASGSLPARILKGEADAVVLEELRRLERALQRALGLGLDTREAEALEVDLGRAALAWRLDPMDEARAAAAQLSRALLRACLKLPVSLSGPEDLAGGPDPDEQTPMVERMIPDPSVEIAGAWSCDPQAPTPGRNAEGGGLLLPRSAIDRSRARVAMAADLCVRLTAIRVGVLLRAGMNLPAESGPVEFYVTPDDDEVVAELLTHPWTDRRTPLGCLVFGMPDPRFGRVAGWATAVVRVEAYGLVTAECYPPRGGGPMSVRYRKADPDAPVEADSAAAIGPRMAV